MIDIDKLLLEKYNVLRRTVETQDAEFITQLRSDIMLSRYIHASDGNVEKQREWIWRYKVREQRKEEYYFIYETLDGTKYGTNRISNIVGKSFVLGSWIFRKDSPGLLSVYCDLSCRDFAFFDLEFEKTEFNVDKLNKGVLRYHRFFNPTIIGENEFEYHFSLSKEQYLSGRNLILSMIQ